MDIWTVPNTNLLVTNDRYIDNIHSLKIRGFIAFPVLKPINNRTERNSTLLSEAISFSDFPFHMR